MNLRKFFSIKTKAQKAQVEADLEKILANCDEIAAKERTEMRQDQDWHDGICPNCRARKNNNLDAIVDKIRNVQGKGSVGGNFLGVSGFVSISTQAVNHCNKCGHEWEKFKTKSISQTHILRVCLNYLAEIVKDSKQKEKEWKVEAVRKAFSGSYAETIYKCYQKEFDYLHSRASLFALRKYYPSVYSPENKEKLEKI